MPYTFAENWDSVTAPALPANWNVSAGIVTSTAQYNTSPNSLVIGSAAAGVDFATNSTVDSGGGYAVDVIGLVYFSTSVSSGDTASCGPTLRCSAATMDNSSTSCYWVRITASTAGSGEYLRFSKVVNGTVTNLASVQNTDAGLTKGAWYAIRVQCSGSNLFNASLTRLSDGYTMNAAGAFGASASTAISSLTAADITSGSYYGFAGQVATVIGNTNNKVYFDGLSINASSGPSLPPRQPLIVPIPFQYYHPD